MTGNNKVWRAPVAGLASVAMLATLGAATANAAPTSYPAAPANYKVSVNGSSWAEAYPGETFVDAAYRAGKTSDWDFGSYTLDGQQFDLFDTPINSDIDLKLDTDLVNPVTVQFINTNGKVQLPFGDEIQVEHNTVLGENAVPLDVAGDGYVIEQWKVTYPGGATETVSTADIATVNVQNPSASGNITIEPVIPDEVNATTITFKDEIESGIVSGQYSDGNVSDDRYSVDVLDGQTVAAPDALYNNAEKELAMLEGWTAPHTDQVAVGGEVTPQSDPSRNVYSPKTTAGVRVYFYDEKATDAKLLGTQVRPKNGYVDVDQVPTASKEGYFFNGWYNWDDDKKVPMNAATGKYDFTGIKLAAPTYFYADLNNEDTIVTVTFRDGEYDGANDPVQVEVRADEFLSEDQAPDWTRPGYVLAYWKLVNSKYTEKDFFLEQNTLVAGDIAAEKVTSPAGMDFTLEAVWARVDSKDAVEAAFDYVDAEDEGFFTAASWKEFSAAYDAAEKKYESYQYNSDTVSPAQASELVSDLKSAWERLVFKHGTGADSLARSTVHRLSKGAEHFYTNDTMELAYMVATQGWTDEGRLFDSATATNKGVSAGKFAEFGNEQLAAAADPIVKPVYRVYNKANGDHVWTVDANEHDVLAAQADWNDEGVAFYTPTFTGTTNVVRLYKDNRHLLSTDGNEQAVLSTQQGWTNEGTAFLGY